MANLPEEFVGYTRQLMGEERFERYLQAFEEAPPVSIRLNPRKTEGLTAEGERVPWCEQGYYLRKRPQFTFDPLLHAGCYYVQEAASMFLDQVLRQHLPDRPVRALDLCAAPGGKSTLLRSRLAEGSMLVSNEPVRSRAQVLAENIWKWGWPDCYVTNAYPRDFRRSKQQFDVILCDVPCSGEGMFRRDEATIGEWSPQQVEKCWRLQRDIVSDAWECLRDGGLMIYSTCTFNTKENEENVRWLLAERDAEVLSVDTRAEWNITGSLLPDFEKPVYRFIPGITRGEGLFVCAIRKGGECSKPKSSSTPLPGVLSPMMPETDGDTPMVELSYQQAMQYLRREALVLPDDTPRGLVTITFMGRHLGLAKNIGTRANNLYPKEWKIKTTHIPNEYETILRPA